VVESDLINSVFCLRSLGFNSLSTKSIMSKFYTVTLTDSTSKCFQKSRRYKEVHVLRILRVEVERIRWPFGTRPKRCPMFVGIVQGEGVQ
jgi:hypothetical protein